MSTNENTPTEKLDVYARVTDQIINAIKKKGVKRYWKMPLANGRDGSHRHQSANHA